MFLGWRSPKRALSSPFQLGPDQRSLKVFYDRDTFLPGMATTLLDELQSAPDMDVESTQLDGEACVEFTRLSDGGLGVMLKKHNGYSETYVHDLSLWSHFAHRQYKNDEQLPDGLWKNPNHRLRRLLLLDVARTHNADLFITDDRFLLEVNDIEFRGTNVVSTLDGIAILGAHLRSRRIFTYKSSPDGKYTAYLAGNSFYVGCRRAIQDMSPILNSHFNDPEMKRAVDRAFYAIAPRTEQLLRARDSAVFALLQPHDHHAFDDALFALDMFMLVLGSTFDSLAQMADAILSLNSRAQYPDWRNGRWLQALRAKDPDLASLVGPQAKCYYMLQLHALLRNVIHGSIHQDVILTDNSLPPEGFIIPESDHQLVRHAVRQMGGTERFGAREQDGELWLRPGPTIEAFLDEGMLFVNSVILELARKLPSSEPNPSHRDTTDNNIDLRCAYLAGITDLATFRFRDR